MYLALAVIFLIVSVLMAAIIAITTFRSIKNNGNFITKKNLLYLAPTFLIIYFLHLTAAIFNGDDIDFFYCFSLIYTTLEVLKFKAVKALLLPICKAYPLYYVDFVLAFIIGGITVILSVASFFGRRIGNYVIVKKLLGSKCDIVIGASQDALKYLKNVKNCLLLGVDISGQKYVDLMKRGVPVLRVPLDVKQLSRKLVKGGYNIIVFRDGNYSYTKIIDTFIKATNNGETGIYLEANQQEMKILKQKFISKADNQKLYIAGFSKYELMARRFVVDHPITKYIPRSFYNDNYSLKGDKDINVVFIGFGKVNYQLFRMCAMQFQFAGMKGNRLTSKPVNYYVYDNRDESLHNEFFSRILYEFEDEFADCDFPRPEKICELKDIRRIDINSVDAKKKFKELVGENSFTYFVVSLESDLEDASYAQTVKRLLCDNVNYRIFVRAKNNNGERLNDNGDRIVYFGEEKSLYTHESIVNDDLTELAQRINLLYSNISDPPDWLRDLKSKKLSAEEQRKILDERLSDPDNMKYMLKKWSSLPNIEQESNLYHAMNLPFKLNLLGFDMMKKDSDNDLGITENEFNDHYKNSGSPNYDDYAFFFGTESSNVLAFIEHSRWNALYILYDYKQMKKSDIKVEDKQADGNSAKIMPHKNIALKQHACITTYYGLHDLIAFKYKTLYDRNLNEKNYRDDPRLQELSKIYAYDYMDLDRLYSEITAMGYKLVKSGE